MLAILFGQRVPPGSSVQGGLGIKGPDAWLRTGRQGNNRSVPRLRKSDCYGPGISRRRRGKGFSYRWTTGEPVTDPDILRRITGLVLPPAWENVWICPWPHGHIQAIGTDNAGRRQYRYHDVWRVQRDREKFERVQRFGRSLPQLRSVVERDLQAEEMPQTKVLAAAVRLLDLGFFRIGGEEYAEEHETFGVATLLKRHVTLHKNEMVFDYPAKGSIRRTVTVTDAATQEVIRTLKHRRGGSDHLLAYKTRGKWVDIRSDDVNSYIRESAGGDFSAKTFERGPPPSSEPLNLPKPPYRVQRTRARRRLGWR